LAQNEVVVFLFHFVAIHQQPIPLLSLKHRFCSVIFLQPFYRKDFVLYPQFSKQTCLMKSLSSKQETGFSSVVPVEPSSSKPSKFNFNKDSSKVKEISQNAHPGRKGRKIVDAPNSRVSGAAGKQKSPEKNNESTRARGRKQNANADDVDKLLENDAAALLNMRKDIQIAQEKEMVKARAYLASLQKENNVLKISNDAQSKQYAELVDTQATLEAYIKEGEGNAGACYRIIDGIKDNLKEVEGEMEAEGRTRDMMAFMRHRLEQEIFSIKSATHELSQQLEQVRSEYAGVETAVRITRVELAAEEKHVETLHKAVRERTEQRVVKMQQLQNLVNDGENSVARAQDNVVSYLCN
jgi:chromosome segregation ATPase